MFKSLQEAIHDLVSEYGYEAVQWALSNEIGGGRPPLSPKRALLVYGIVETARRGKPCSTLTETFKYISRMGGIPEPRIEKGKYKKHIIKPVGSIKRLYYEANDFMKRDPSWISTTNSFVSYRIADHQSSELSFDVWMRMWLKELYKTAPASWEGGMEKFIKPPLLMNSI